MFSFGISGVFFLVVMGTIACFQRDFELCLVDYTFAFILFLLLLYLRKSHNSKFCCYTAIGLFSFLCWYLFMFNTGGGYSFLWLYIYPLATLFLLGSRHGGMAIVIFSFPVWCFFLQLSSPMVIRAMSWLLLFALFPHFYLWHCVP